MTTGLRKKYQSLTHRRMKELLKEIEKTGNLVASCAAVNIDRSTLYQAMKRKPELKDAVELARHKAAYAIEKELRRRGIEGYEEKVFHGGEQIGTQTRYSDRLLELLAKGNIAKYGKLEENLGVHINIGADSVKNKLASMLGVEVKQPETVEGEFRELD
jgi:hypothetical protein